MARSKSISIAITGNSAPLRKELKQASQELSAFGKAQSAFSKASTFAYGLAGTAVIQFATDAVKSASDLEESQNKVRQVFGTSAAEIERWAGNSSRALGQSARQALEAAGTYGNLFRAFGTTEKEAAAMSMRLVELASDLASFNNTPVDDALQALRSGLTGEAEPLKRFGIALTDARLKQEALTLGLIETTTAALPPAIKAQAAYSIALQDSSLAQGDFSRTSDGLANSTKTLSAQIQDLQAKFGELLLPTVQKAVNTLSDAAEITEKTSNPLAGLTKILGDVAGGFNDLIFEATGLNAIGNELVTTWDMVWLEISGRRRAAEAKENLENLGLQYEALSAILRRNQALFEETTTYVESQTEAAAKAERQVGYLKDQYKAFSDVTLDQVEAQKEAAKSIGGSSKASDKDTKAKKKQKKETVDTAKSFKDVFGEALDDANEKLQEARDFLADMQKNLADARQEAVDFGKSLAYSFDVSLAGAYATATASEQTYTDALQARSKAYDALDVAKQGDDLNAYLKAVQDVAAAEDAVTKAQAARVTPTAAFSKQIEDAKTFGANLKTLIGQGLGQAGLSQLLGLGPTAGAEVTSAILAGTAGFTVGGLNQSLKDLSDVQAGLAAQVTQTLAPTLPVTQAETAVAQAMTQVSAAEATQATAAASMASGIDVSIYTGVGDPVAIGRAVSDYLFAYDMRTASEIKGPNKKKAKRR